MFIQTNQVPKTSPHFTAKSNGMASPTGALENPQPILQELSKLLKNFMANQIGNNPMMPVAPGSAGLSTSSPGIENFLGFQPTQTSGNSAWNNQSVMPSFNATQRLQSFASNSTGRISGGTSDIGSRISASINSTPVPPRCRPGYCYRGVKHHLRQVGVNLTGGSAYMAADQLAGNSRFREIQVSRQELRNLPAGAVVVWDRNPQAGKRHGHISVATGDGREASDKIRRQIVNYPSSHRVFVPR